MWTWNRHCLLAAGTAVLRHVQKGKCCRVCRGSHLGVLFFCLLRWSFSKMHYTRRVTVQMYVYRYMCLLSMFFLWHSPKEFCIFEWKKTEERATSFGLLPWCSFVQLPWTQGVGWCDLNCPWLWCQVVMVPLRWSDMSAVCKAATSSDADKARERWKLRTATAIFNKKCLQFRHWRSSGWSSLAPLLNRLCWPSHFVPAMKWSRRKPVSSWLNLKVAIPDSRG